MEDDPNANLAAALHEYAEAYGKEAAFDAVFELMMALCPEKVQRLQ